MKQSIKISVKFLFVMTLLLGLLYPLSMTGVGQVVFSNQVNGQLIEKNGEVVGSKLLGQSWTGPEYLHGRPQEVSQLSPVSTEQKELVSKRIKERQAIEEREDKVPSELVLASASGLDPDISLEAAYYQAPRIARERQVTEELVNGIINEHKTGIDNVLLSNQKVNVLLVNLALDEIEEN